MKKFHIFLIRFRWAPVRITLTLTPTGRVAIHLKIHENTLVIIVSTPHIYQTKKYKARRLSILRLYNLPFSGMHTVSCYLWW